MLSISCEKSIARPIPISNFSLPKRRVCMIGLLVHLANVSMSQAHACQDKHIISHMIYCESEKSYYKVLQMSKLDIIYIFPGNSYATLTNNFLMVFFNKEEEFKKL